MKSLPQWGATALLVAPFGAWGLGLGDIELQSALNEPFSAEIVLTSATAEELETLRVGLAGLETFERYGLDRPAELSSLEFRVVRNAAGRSVIRVTSSRPMADPFLTMLVEATWPRGRLLREYTVLLDPPLFSPDLGAEPPVRQAATSAPQQGAGAIARTPSPAAAPASAATAASGSAASSSSSSSSAASAGGGRYGPVQESETLWSIASGLRPGDVSINQMMVALYEANPGAFDGNMNVLRRGATLTVPERERLLATSSAAATAEVARQESSWASARGAAVADAPAPADAGASPAAESAQARLRLVPAAADPAAGGAEAGASGQVSGAGGDAAAGAEVARLRSEVESLRGELDESRRLLELRNEELLELQARLGDAGQAVADEAAVEAPVDALPAAAPGVDLESEQLFADEAPLPEDEAAAGAGSEDAGAADVEAAAPAAAAVSTPAVTTPAVTTSASEPSLLSRIFGWISNPLLLIGLGIGAVLLTAVWYLRHRRDDDVTGRWEALEADVDDDTMAREDTARVPHGDFGGDDTLGELRQAGAGAAVAPMAAAAASGAAELDIDETLSSQTVINLDQADSLAEADFHMAYGLYDQAADLVQKALESEPGRRDLKLKLLEVYFVWGNKDAFLDAARGLHAEIGGQGDRDWDKVLIMGKQICPDEALFDESAAGGGDLDVDLQGDGSTELDFAFGDRETELNLDDDGAEAIGASTGTGLDFELAATGERIAGAFDDDELEVTAGAEAVGAASAAGGNEDYNGGGSSYAFDESLDIGASTAAGLEAALFTDDDDDPEQGHAFAAQDDEPQDDDVVGFGDAFGDQDDETGTSTAPGVDADLDGLAVTQESPTVERPQADEDDWSMLAFDGPTVEEPLGPDSPTMETPTMETPTVETPTVENPAAHAPTMQLEGYDAPTVETEAPDAPTVETAGSEAPTVETPTLETAYGGTARLEVPSSDVSGSSEAGDHTEEIDLDDLGLNLDDLGTLSDVPVDLADLAVDDGDSDTREQPALEVDADLLSATGVTEVLADDEELEHMNTEVLGDQDATLLAPGYGGDGALEGTEILEERRDASDTSLLKMLDGTGGGHTSGSSGNGLDLDLEDLASALEGDTVEQPRSSFESDVFGGGGDTPIDLDVGLDIVGSDDPTGTEDIGPLDPQTMTEIGTKLDLARAYIDMGDPEGARSILEEVLDEGDSGQRREAQGLIDVLSA